MLADDSVIRYRRIGARLIVSLFRSKVDNSFRNLYEHLPMDMQGILGEMEDMCNGIQGGDDGNETELLTLVKRLSFLVVTQRKERLMDPTGFAAYQHVVFLSLETDGRLKEVRNVTPLIAMVEYWCRTIIADVIIRQQAEGVEEFDR